MKSILVFVIILLFPALSFSQPSIEFDEEIHDFGAVTQGDNLEHVFMFTNTGDEDLIIDHIKSS